MRSDFRIKRDRRSYSAAPFLQLECCAPQLKAGVGRFMGYENRTPTRVSFSAASWQSSAMRLTSSGFDKYGNIAWKMKRPLRQFAGQLMHEPMQSAISMFGRVVCRAGVRPGTCCSRDELHDGVRGAKPEPVLSGATLVSGTTSKFQSGSLARGKPPMFVPDYQRSTEHHMIKICGADPLRANRRVKPWRAPHKALQLDGAMAGCLKNTALYFTRCELVIARQPTKAWR
jgi:hypothetical protein